MVINTKEKGFTLIEFFLYAIIVSAMITTMVGVGNNIMSARQKIVVYDKLEHSGRVSLTTISKKVREAQAVALPATLGDESGILSLEMPATGPVFFYAEDSFLIMEEGGEKKNLTSDAVRVVEVSFKNKTIEGAPPTVAVDILIEYKNPLSRSDYDIQRSFRTTENVRRVVLE